LVEHGGMNWGGEGRWSANEKKKRSPLFLANGGSMQRGGKGWAEGVGTGVGGGV